MATTLENRWVCKYGESPEAGLVIKVVNQQIVISVGIKTMATVAEIAGDMTVTDIPVFAESMIRALREEQEDGTTPVHHLLEAAADWCLEQGEEGLFYDGEE
jgi:hypothetical protein